jgi:hypothetical protein
MNLPEDATPSIYTKDGFFEFAEDVGPECATLTPTPPSTDEPKAPSSTFPLSHHDNDYKRAHCQKNLNFTIEVDYCRVQRQNHILRDKRQVKMKSTSVHHMLRRSRVLKDDLFYELDSCG